MKIAFIGGGTLGSVSPLLAVANTYDRSEAIWIGTHDGVERPYVEKLGIRFFDVPSYRLRRFFSLSNITHLPKIALAYFKASRILEKEQIEVIIGAGSFVQVPVFYSASRRAIRSYILQLDIQEGLANKLCKRWATAIFSATHHTLGHKNIQMTGIPVLNTEDKNSFAFLKKSTLPTALVLGGSTGSQWLNKFVLQESKKLLQTMNIIHFQGNINRTIKMPEMLAPGKYITYSNAPLELVHDAMRIAQCAVSRAGMSTIAELSYYGVPAILVPIPKSHQVYNAQYCKDMDCAELFNQEEGFADLRIRLSKLSRNKIDRDTYRDHCRRVFPHDAINRIRAGLGNL